jgi:hypothetical protein
MADDLKQTGRQDDQRIDQDHELSYWSEKLGVSRDRLRQAVAKVGPMRVVRCRPSKRAGQRKALPETSVIRAVADELGVNNA